MGIFFAPLLDISNECRILAQVFHSLRTLLEHFVHYLNHLIHLLIITYCELHGFKYPSEDFLNAFKLELVLEKEHLY
jgi:hypothetical protein